MAHNKRVKGTFYLIVVLLVWLGYTLIAELLMNDHDTEQNIMFVTFLGQFCLSLFMIPSTFKLVWYPRTPETTRQWKEGFYGGLKCGVLLMVCNYTYNAGLMMGNVTTGDTISCTVPNWVYLFSLVVDLPG